MIRLYKAHGAICRHYTSSLPRGGLQRRVKVLSLSSVLSVNTYAQTCVCRTIVPFFFLHVKSKSTGQAGGTFWQVFPGKYHTLVTLSPFRSSLPIPTHLLERWKERERERELDNCLFDSPNFKLRENTKLEGIVEDRKSKKDEGKIHIFIHINSVTWKVETYAPSHTQTRFFSLSLSLAHSFTFILHGRMAFLKTFQQSVKPVGPTITPVMDIANTPCRLGTGLWLTFTAHEHVTYISGVSLPIHVLPQRRRHPPGVTRHVMQPPTPVVCAYSDVCVCVCKNDPRGSPRWPLCLLSFHS